MRNTDQAIVWKEQESCKESQFRLLRVFSQHRGIGKNLEEASLLTLEVPGRCMDLNENFHWPQTIYKTAASGVPDCTANTSFLQEKSEYIFKI